MYRFQGAWLVGDELVGVVVDSRGATKFWSVARGEKGKLVVYCKGIDPDSFGTVMIAESHQELSGKIPARVFERLELALGLRQVYDPPERTLDV